MPGPEVFSNPFEGAQWNGNGPTRNPSAIGTGRGRAGSTINRTNGHSPTAQSNSTSGSENHAIWIRKLPQSSTMETVRGMLLFAQDCIHTEIVPSSEGDEPYLTAVARFKSAEGAVQAAQALNAKQLGDNNPALQVEIVSLTPGGSASTRRFPETTIPDGSLPRHNSRFSDTFRDMDHVPSSQPGNKPLGRMDSGLVDGLSPTFRNAHTNGTYGVPVHTGNGNAYNPTSPIGHPSERQHISGRSMIQEDGADDETDQLMQDPGSFMSAERQSHFMQQGRRATAPNISIGSRLNGLSLNSNVGPSVSPLNASGGVTSPRGQPGHPAVQSPGGTAFSPSSVGNSGGYGNSFGAASPTSPQWQPFQRSYQTLPPVNPADQNPPCNTLYVGNLPMDTSEDELKSLFSRARGYRRLCFRMKSNGPMCFVEFEDVSHATRALKDIYGVPLSNSVRGGIRLSFSKNPLGVRGPATQSPVSPSNGHGASPGTVTFGGPLGGYSNANNQGFSTASGPPPGLPTPQGFSQPVHRSGSIAGPSGNGTPNPGSHNPHSLSNGFQPPGFGESGRFGYGR